MGRKESNQTNKFSLLSLPLFKKQIITTYGMLMTYSLHARTNLYYSSFFPSTIRAWNSLPEDTKQYPSISSFKFRLNRDMNKPPKYYRAGTRMVQILHTGIRLKCSSLNTHLYRKNIVPEPTCQCGGFESSYHFFFVCPIFVDARSRCLPASLINLTTRDL